MAKKTKTPTDARQAERNYVAARVLALSLGPAIVLLIGLVLYYAI